MTPIQAAAKAAFESWSRDEGHGSSLPWEDLHEESQRLWIKLARAARTAYAETERTNPNWEGLT